MMHIAYSPQSLNYYVNLQIVQADIEAHFGQRCLAIQAQYRTLTKKEVKSLVDYFEALQVASLENVRSAIKVSWAVGWPSFNQLFAGHFINQ